jgi:hypothetical protein
MMVNPEHVPASAGTANQVEVIAGTWHIREFLVVLDPAHNLLQDEKFG